ncbi:MAG: YdbH domain-containing protein [Opitutaceae bacterium]|nr:YdbH domain-containing protein [Opitutaceae bacterium]
MFSTDPAAPQTLSFSRFEAGGVEIHDGRAVFALAPGGLLRLESFRAGGLGGSLDLAPIALDLARPSADIRAKVSGLDSARLAAYLPAAVSEAHGRLSGDIAFHWDPRAGLDFGGGHLSLQKTEPASLRLAPAPGFFTARVPAQIALLGGPLRRFLTIRNPAYDTLGKIELGEMPLAVESIEAGFDPGGDGQGRTARIAIVARPTASGGGVKIVRFNINIYGPLDKTIRFGLDDRINFSW